MNLKWIGICLLLFLPIIFLGAYFNAVSYEKMNIPFASFDMANTHYQLDTDYAPLIQWLNRKFFSLGQPIYDMYFISLVYSMCFIIPFIILYDLSKGLELPTFFLYGTAIGANHFVVGLLPQAILINLILLIGIERRLTLPFFIIAWFIHSFGGIFILLGYLFWRFYDKQNT